MKAARFPLYPTYLWHFGVKQENIALFLNIFSFIYDSFIMTDLYIWILSHYLFILQPILEIFEIGTTILYHMSVKWFKSYSSFKAGWTLPFTMSTELQRWANFKYLNQFCKTHSSRTSLLNPRKSSFDFSILFGLFPIFKGCWNKQKY